MLARTRLAVPGLTGGAGPVCPAPVLLMAFVLACAGSSIAQVVEEPSTPAPRASNDKVSDRAVERAILKGIGFLWSRQNETGSWSDAMEEGSFPLGPTGLVAYSLLESGVKPQDERMAKALAWLEKHDSEMTYCLAFRASAFAAAARKNQAFLKPLSKDVERLCRSVMSDGGHSYFALNRPLTTREQNLLITWAGGGAGSDPSNSQYALLAAWAGGDLGVEIPRKYWEMALGFWARSQRQDGGWGYVVKMRPESYGSMTVAGLASLFICLDNLYASRYADCGVNTDVPAIKNGMDWLERDFRGTLRKSGGIWFYYLFGIERVGLASGYKYFGKVDWYQVGAAELLASQREDGSWKTSGWGDGGDVTATAYALLFLIRGRQAVLFNKLQYGGDWNNRPRDLATLTRWARNTLETSVHWQIINLNVPVAEWHDAPILYIAGSKGAVFRDEEIGKLRQFVQEGGAIFSCTEGGGAGFSQVIRKVYEKMFPKHPLTPLPQDHPIYSFQYKLLGRPKFHMITNGIRPLAIHTDEDLPRPWQLDQRSTARWAFEAGANLYLYLTDRMPLRSRGTSLWVEAPDPPAGAPVKIARLKCGGTYDPEPLAYTRFARLMARDTGIVVEPTEPMEIAQLPDSDAKIAVLTGTERLALGDEERQALKKFVASGGLLVLDAAGGSKAFAESAEQLLVGVFGQEAMTVVGSGSPFHQLKGMEIRKLKVRPAARKRLGAGTDPELIAAKVEGRIGAVLSPLDITGALLGPPSAMCDGYDPETAFELMRNFILVATGISASTTAPASTEPSTQPGEKLFNGAKVPWLTGSKQNP